MNRFFAFGMLIGLTLFSCGKPISEVQNSTTDYKKEAATLDSLLLSAADAPQRFEISSSKSSTITGANGIFIRIDPNSLESENGKPLASTVEVELREFPNLEDYVFTGVRTTASNGKQILSSGTYHLQMKSGGNTVRIKPGSAITVDFPQFSSKRMELFTAGKDSLQITVWVPSNQRLKRLESQIETDEKYYLPMPVNRLGWMASAVFNRANFGAAAFDLKEDKNFSFGKAFFIVTDNGTTVSMESNLLFNGKDDLFFDGVPDNGEALIVCAALKKGKFYAFAKRLSMDHFAMPLIELEEMTPKELAERVKKLK